MRGRRREETISSPTNNLSKFNEATKTLVSSTNENLGGRMNIFIGILGVLAVLGIALMIFKASQGFDTKSNWGYYAAFVSVLLGIFGTAPMVAIAPLIAKADWHRPIARISSLFTIASLSTVIMMIPLIFALPPLVVNGVRRRSIWFDANIYTPHVFFGLAVFGLFFIGIGMLWVSSIPDLATMRDHSGGWRQRMGRKLSRGFIGSEGQWKSLRARIGIMSTFYLMFLIFVHILYSVNFSLELVAGWKDAIYPMYHAMTGIQVGLASTIIALFLFRKFWKLEKFILVDQFWGLAKLLFATTIFWFYFFICAFIVFWYGRTAMDMMTIKILITGPYLPIFLGSFFLCFIIPWWIIIWNPVRKNPRILLIISLIVVLGHILDRIRLYVISWQVYSDEMIHNKFIPLDEIPTEMIIPSAIDILIFVGAFSFGILLMVVSTKLLPVISIWETHQSTLLTRHIKFLRTEVYAVGKPD